MSVVRIKIDNYKSIKKCDISINKLTLIIGENGTGKTNILEAINYFYSNITSNNVINNVFDLNNHFSNEVKITLTFDMEKFINIAISQIKKSIVNNIRYVGYYKKIISMTDGGTERYLNLTMQQIKNKEIKWNCEYEDRFIIKSLFPLFFVNTRKIDISNWGAIWDIIGDLSKVSNIEHNELHREIKAILISNQREIAKKIDKVGSIFDEVDVNVKRTVPRDFAKLLTQIFYDGNLFINNGQGLNYFSDGTNSVNYIKLLLKTVCEITSLKLKQPFVIIDEPEINLHNLYIDQLSDELVNNSNYYNILISTHSARLTKNIIKSGCKITTYHTKLISNYSYVSKMKLFSNMDYRAKNFITDEHANAYFSKAMLLVEGETEVELFLNEYLVELYPFLKYFDIYKSLSNNVVRNLIIPDKVNTRIPYISIMDMDKIISYDKTKNKFAINTRESYLLNNLKQYKESFLFNRKGSYLRNDTYVTLKRIMAMTEKCRFHYYKIIYGCEDPNFLEYINLIKGYLLNYNIYACRTTIEGTLITKESSAYILEYTRQTNNEKVFEKFKKIYESFKENDQINILRLLYKGKTDLLLKMDKTDLNQKQKEGINLNGKDKTAGWITDFFAYYFKKVCNNNNLICSTISDFKKLIKDEYTRDLIRDDFMLNFPELNDILKLCKIIINDII